MYTSPLPRLDGYLPVKVITRIVLFVAVFGGLWAQLTFLAHSEPSNTRRIYVVALLVIECIPMMFIMFYRMRGRPIVQMSQRLQWLWVISIFSLIILVSRLSHEIQLNQLYHPIDQRYKMITLVVAGVLVGCVNALLHIYGVIKKK
jgi:membrane-associated HD superfamily phosphohydrolase